VGRYVVQASGDNVPIASQPYALAVGGPIGAVTVPEQFKLWLPVLLRQ